MVPKLHFAKVICLKNHKIIDPNNFIQMLISSSDLGISFSASSSLFLRILLYVVVGDLSYYNSIVYYVLHLDVIRVLKLGIAN